MGRFWWRLLAVAVLLGIGSMAVFVGSKTCNFGEQYNYSTSAISTLRQLFIVWSNQTQSGSRYAPIDSMEDLRGADRFDPELLSTRSEITGEETPVVYFPALDKRPGVDPLDILFCFKGPVGNYPSDKTGEDVPTYFAVTYGGQVVRLEQFPAGQAAE